MALDSSVGLRSPMAPSPRGGDAKQVGPAKSGAAAAAKATAAMLKEACAAATAKFSPVSFV